jgi:hypothetical protein
MLTLLPDNIHSIEDKKDARVGLEINTGKAMLHNESKVKIKILGTPLTSQCGQFRCT